jgi:glutathione synthase/RimK-type ligase-like ATP-grasp enzyme
MKNKIMGYIFCGSKLGGDEKAFLKIAKKKNIELVLFNLEEDFDNKKIIEKINKCDIIFNNSAEEEAFELEKTIEVFGKKVIDSPKIAYEFDDKWTFFLECRKHGIPTINTILLSENLKLAEKELKEFNQWPVILKRIEGTCGEYVDKAGNIKEAIKIIKKFWKKGSQRLPVIAQEYILSPCYRVLTIGDKIVQSAVKHNNGWKKTGVYEKTKSEKFKIDKDLRKIIMKIIKMSKINVCGIDLLKKEKNWLVLEINTVPALDFFPKERDKLAGMILDLLVRKIQR